MAKIINKEETKKDSIYDLYLLTDQDKKGMFNEYCNQKSYKGFKLNGKLISAQFVYFIRNKIIRYDLGTSEWLYNPDLDLVNKHYYLWKLFSQYAENRLYAIGKEIENYESIII